MLPTVHFNRQKLGSKNFYYVHFKFSRELFSYFRNYDHGSWDTIERCWFFPESAISPAIVQSELEGKALVSEVTYPLKSVEHKRARLKPIEHLPELDTLRLNSINSFSEYLTSKRYSLNTVNAYCEALRTFFRFTSSIPIEEINDQSIIDFNNNYILKNGYSSSFQNQVVNAIKLYFKVMQSERLLVDLIQRPRREKLLPNVLSREEVKSILNSPVNLKHRMMLSLLYACGLRRSELLNLKPMHILSDRHLIHIKCSKGKKDRVVPIGATLLEQLREYYKLYRPVNYLFEGQVKGHQYSETSLQKVLKEAIKKAKIQKPVTLHWLRHRSATHLLESGTDLRYIQELLGHSSSRTTEIYTHVSTQNIQNIISPFESL